MTISHAVIGDIGGTNFRLGLSTPQGIENIQELQYNDKDTPESLITAYVSSCTDPALITHAVFAVATPSSNPKEIVFTNGPWRQRPVDFTRDDMRVTMLNDFAALTYSIARLTEEDCVRLNEGTSPPFMPALQIGKSSIAADTGDILLSSPAKRFAIVGAGTGLGASSGLVTETGKFLVLDGEGGHTSFSPENEAELKAALYIEDNETVAITNETIASGTGLPKIFNAYCAVNGINLRAGNAADISNLARNGTPPEQDAAVWALDLFAKSLGKCSASLVLINNARTLFIAGGIVPKLDDLFNRQAFLHALQKNDLGHNNFTRDVPALLINHDNPGLLGAHAYFRLTSK